MKLPIRKMRPYYRRRTGKTRMANRPAGRRRKDVRVADKIVPGLVSVTLRKKSPDEVIEMAQETRLKAIEWTSSCHVPSGDITLASGVRAKTENAGIAIAGYSSYYRAGIDEQKDGPFEQVLETAQALGAPIIRIWAGRQGSAKAPESYWQAVVRDARRCAEMAAKAGLLVAFEYHGLTLNDTAESAVRLMREIGHPAMKSYWQPDYGASYDDRITALEEICPYLYTIHVFHWPSGERAPLEKGHADWRRYLRHANDHSDARFALLEFVERDYPENVRRDAETLRDILSIV